MKDPTDHLTSDNPRPEIFDDTPTADELLTDPTHLRCKNCGTKWDHDGDVTEDIANGDYPACPTCGSDSFEYADTHTY